MLCTISLLKIRTVVSKILLVQLSSRKKLSFKYLTFRQLTFINKSLVLKRITAFEQCKNSTEKRGNEELCTF